MNRRGIDQEGKEGLIPLADAARRAGCHVSTLRARIRRGELESVRGPHGAYYVSAWDIRDLCLRSPGWPPREILRSAEEERASWEVLFESLRRPLYTRELRHARRVISDPDFFPALFHLLSVHRLRALGLTFRQIAQEVGISTRQARRLAARDAVWALHFGMFTRLGWAEKRRALREAREVGAQLRARLVADGVASHTPRLYSRLHPFSVKGPILVQPEPTTLNLARLHDAGLSAREIDAVMLVGVTAEELNELFLRGMSSLSR